MTAPPDSPLAPELAAAQAEGSADVAHGHRRRTPVRATRLPAALVSDREAAFRSVVEMLSCAIDDMTNDRDIITEGPARHE